MAGIINYYHGERGRVGDKNWEIGDHLTYVLDVVDNPHRSQCYDYGADIAIDPNIQVGDSVEYFRLDPVCGLWTMSDTPLENLPTAAVRALQNRKLIEEYERLKVADEPERRTWLSGLAMDTHVPLREQRDGGLAHPDRPNTAASLFLSYSSRNVLIAREIYEDIRTDAIEDVWFDLARPGEAPGHDDQVEEWLRLAVYGARGVVLLLTGASAASPWVEREVRWANERAAADPGFKVVILKLEDVSLPPASDESQVIDVKGLLNGGVGIREELFAAVLGREGRRQWLSRQGAHESGGSGFSYDDFKSDSGVVISFDAPPGGRQPWVLEYFDGAERRRITGSGHRAPVDLALSPGDKVGSFVWRRHRGTELDDGITVWMRSDDLTLSPDDVLDAYYEYMGADQLKVVSRRLVDLGRNTLFGSRLMALELLASDGRWYSMADFSRMTFTRSNADKLRAIGSGDG